MSDASFKSVRKQLRNVVQELLPALLTAELYENLKKEMLAANAAHHEKQSKYLNDTLGAIDGAVKESLKKQDERARSVQGFITQLALKNVNDLTYNTNVTMQAWQELMAEKIGNVEDFNKQLDERKAIVHARLVKQHEEKMKRDIEAKTQPEQPAPTT